MWPKKAKLHLAFFIFEKSPKELKKGKKLQILIQKS